MPIIRKKLAPAEVYPDDLRYNADTDTVQSFVNGEWVDNPEADPRTKTVFPPRLTSDPACDAAESVKDAIKGQIDGVVEAIDNASTLFTIASIILSIFTFGAYAIFISLALGIGDQMVGFGTAAITAALTDPVWDTFKCILYCNMNSSGRLRVGGFEQVMADVNDQIGGIGATILNAMLSLAGEGGVNNLAAIGTSTGDCSACGCLWCYTFDFEASDGGWISAGEGLGTYDPGVGWRTQFGVLSDGNGYTILELQLAFAAEIKSVDVSVQVTEASAHPYPSNWIYATTNVGTIITSGGTPGVGSYVVNWTGDQTVTGINFLQVSAGYINGASDPGGIVILKTVTIRGLGTNPFGSDNCGE